MSFFENTRKPVGFGGKIMVAMMNMGHSPVARWGLRFLELTPDAKVLDCGCGGGANIKRLLKKCPQGIVKGIDYSPVSVEKSKKVNKAAISKGRCAVLQGSVADMIFADEWFDADVDSRFVCLCDNVYIGRGIAAGCLAVGPYIIGPCRNTVKVGHFL